MSALLRTAKAVGAALPRQRLFPACCAVARNFASEGIEFLTHQPLAEDLYCRQRSVLPLGLRVPWLAPDAWVAPSAVVLGDVDIYDKVSVWYGAVLRGDLNSIRVGSFSSIGDNCVIHSARTSPTGLSAATLIGKWVTVGPGCLLRSTRIGHCAVIGEKSVLLEGSVVESNAVLAPGSVLPPARLVPGGQLWAGNPARYVRDLTKDEIEEITKVSGKVEALMEQHVDGEMPFSTLYRQVEKLRAPPGEAAESVPAAEGAAAEATPQP